MSNDPFPERVTPRKWCDRNGTINSSIPLGKLLRLSEYLDDNHGQAVVSLSFDRDASGYCCLTGNVSAQVSMQCQRCLETTAVVLKSDLDIKVASDEDEGRRIAEETANSLDRLEIVFSEEGELDLLSVIEDELIMSLPIVAVHDDQCSDQYGVLHVDSEGQGNTEPGNIQGLDVLETLKQDLKKHSKEGQGNKSNND
jgi:uncharacterized protein